MRPVKSNQAAKTSPNLPHADGRNARFGDHVDDFVEGFAEYANFLLRHGRGAGRLFDGFAGVPVRNVVRATRFYYMLLQRLRNHKAMDDGVIWSAQADFIARLSVAEGRTRGARCAQRAAFRLAQRRPRHRRCLRPLRSYRIALGP
jgi:lantibiotic modifying enzyme